MLQSVSLLSVLTRAEYSLASGFGAAMAATILCCAVSLSKSASLESRSLFSSELPQCGDRAITLAQSAGMMSIGDSMPDELGDGAADSDDDWLDEELVLAVHSLDT